MPRLTFFKSKEDLRTIRSRHLSMEKVIEDYEKLLEMKLILSKLYTAKEEGFKTIDDAILYVKTQFSPLVRNIYGREVKEYDFKSRIFEALI